MNHSDIELKLAEEVKDITPDIIDLILSDCAQDERKVIMVEEKKNNRGMIRAVLGMAAALALVITVGGVSLFKNLQEGRVSSIVSFDVNPSLEIMVTKDEHVLDVIANNEDGKKVIGNMDFKGSSLDVTVNALIGSMLRNGYLSEISNSILISVDNNDPAQAKALQDKLTQEINTLLKTDNFSGAVLSQTVSSTDESTALSEQYSISEGKVKLIQQITAGNNLYDFEDLAKLSVNELNLLANGALDSVTSVGNASDKAYIGTDKAKELALGSVGAAESEVAGLKVELDYEKKLMVYEVDFYYNGTEYDIELNAVTGEIVKTDYEKEGKGEHKNKQQDSKNLNVPSDQATQNTASGQSDQSLPDRVSNTEISEADALQIAYNHAGVNPASVMKLRTEMDYEKGRAQYEIEFKADGYEYEYDIDAVSGGILSYDMDLDD